MHCMQNAREGDNRLLLKGETNQGVMALHHGDARKRRQCAVAFQDCDEGGAVLKYLSVKIDSKTRDNRHEQQRTPSPSGALVYG